MGRVLCHSYQRPQRPPELSKGISTQPQLIAIQMFREDTGRVRAAGLEVKS